MKPKVIILELMHDDGIALLKSFSDVKLALGLSREEILGVIKDCHVVVVKSVTQVDSEFMDHAKNLRVIARAGTGLDNIDLVEAKNRGIPVYSVPTGNTISAAEFTVLNILNLCRRYIEIREFVSRSDYRRHLLEGRELNQMTVGLVGLGNVGCAVAQRLLPFGCQVLAYDPFLKGQRKETIQAQGIILADSIEAIFKRSDLVSLHAALTKNTEKIIDAALLSQARPGLMLVNTARGKLIDDAALLEALDTGKVSFAALDVLSPEPTYNEAPGASEFRHPLMSHPRVIYSPHVAASTVDAQRKIALELVDQIKLSTALELVS